MATTEQNLPKDVDVLEVIWLKKWPILIFSSIVAITTHLGSSFLPSQYEASSSVLVSAPKFSKGDKSNFLSIEDYQRLALSDGLLHAVSETLKPKYPNSTNILDPQIIKNMISLDFSSAETTASKIGRAVLIIFKSTGTDPSLTKDLVNTLVDSLIRKNEELLGGEVKNIAKNTREQYADNLRALTEAEVALQKTMSVNHLDMSELDLELKRSKLKQHESILMRTNVEMVEIQGVNVDEKKGDKLSASQVQNMVSNYPQFLKTSAKQKYLNKEISQIKTEIYNLENLVFKMRLEEKQLKRKISLLRNNNSVLTTRLEKVLISESETKISNLKLISEAKKPRIPIGPNKLKFTLVAFAMSLFLGIITACSKKHIENLVSE